MPTLFPTTVIGSLPRPQYVKDLLKSGQRADRPAGDRGDDAWLRRMDDAVRYAIDLQEQAGIDIVSDGEWRRESYCDVVAELKLPRPFARRSKRVQHAPLGIQFHDLAALRWLRRRIAAVHAEDMIVRADRDAVRTSNVRAFPLREKFSPRIEDLQA